MNSEIELKRVQMPNKFAVAINREMSEIMKVVGLVLIVGLIVFLPATLAAKAVYVRGYYRSNGTYVPPHYRTAPDGNPFNNYSYPGNYNPNTGTITPGDPNKYLERYYARKNSYTYTPTYTPKTYTPALPPESYTNSPCKTPYEYLKRNPKPNPRYSTKYTRGLQVGLKYLGYYIGIIDGIHGRRTDLAIRLFQLAHGLTPDGIIGPLTTKALIDALPHQNHNHHVEVIDGDTFYWDGEKIRIYGIDTPEYGEPGYYTAKIHLALLLSVGTIEIERVAKDKYGRTVAKVRINGIDIKSLMQ